MENKTTFIANLEDLVQSLDGPETGGDATASLSSNPSVNYIKFTLTDDKPNGNKMRVPQEEFPNLINSGIYMPIKKAVNKIEKGHSESFPMGVITHLKQVEDKVKGIATLWSKERPKDVEQIKNELKAGKNVNLSWELTYDTEASEETDGITTLKNVFLTAATIVGLPAYRGRTSIEAFASDERKEEMADELEKELEKAQKERDNFKSQLDELKQKSIEKDTELVGLKSFKAEVEKVESERKKLGTIKQKFTSAKIVKDDKYFEDNKEKLLSLDESTLEFMLQDLKVFTAPETLENKEDKTKIPPITNTTTTPDYTPKFLGEALRTQGK